MADHPCLSTRATGSQTLHRRPGRAQRLARQHWALGMLGFVVLATLVPGRCLAATASEQDSSAQSSAEAAALAHAIGRPIADLAAEPLWNGALQVGAVAEWVISGLSIPEHGQLDGATVVLAVRDPSGNTITRRLFLNQPYVVSDGIDPDHEFRAAGPRSWQVRHLFRTPGRHDLQLIEQHSGTTLRSWWLEVQPSPDRGSIGISANNPRLLAYADGTPLTPIGCNIAWTLRPDRLHTFIRHLDELVAGGGNHCRVWCASWFGQIQGDQPTAARLDHAWLLDQVLLAAQSRGVAVTLVLDNHHDLIAGNRAPYGHGQAEAPTTAASDTSSTSEPDSSNNSSPTINRVRAFLDPALTTGYRQRLGYLVARYGIYDNILAWELFNEIDLVLSDPPFVDVIPQPEQVAAAWANAAAALMHDTDPDRRLITVSVAREDWPSVFASPNIDLVSLHRYVPRPADRADGDEDGVGLVLAALESAHQHGKPILLNEVGHHGEDERTPGNSEDPLGILLRHQAWAGWLGGGCGSAMNWWWDTHLSQNNLWAAYKPMQIASHKLDWTDRFLQPLDANQTSSLRVLGWRSHSQAMIWPQIRADNWQRLNAQDGLGTVMDQPPTIRIPGLAPNQTFNIEALDMFNGHIQNQRPAMSSDTGILEITLSAHGGREILIIRSQLHHDPD